MTTTSEARNKLLKKEQPDVENPKEELIELELLYEANKENPRSREAIRKRISVVKEKLR
tara:strand:- start:1642 stop:1818 length:177 start_codon:yes stop_codon:yes gene_type:complete